MKKTVETPITNLEEGIEALILRLAGGMTFQRKLRTMGIREGKTIKVLAKQPFHGPLVVEVDRKKTTIGRGMAKRIIVGAKK